MKAYSPILLLLSSCILFSCSKSGNDGNPTPTPPKPDTLSSGWSKISVGLPNETFTDVFFVDAAKGYCTSENGIYRSADGGTSWSKIYSGNSFINIAAKGANACFVNNSDTIYFTTDGGASIQKKKYISPDINRPFAFGDVYYTNAGTCFASSNYYFLKSVNGGVLFDTTFHFASNSGGLSSISFLGETEGWVVRVDGIYRTINGGYYFEPYNRPTPGGALLISYYSLPLGYLTTSNVVYKTSDNGNSWQTVFTNNGLNGFYIDIAIINDQTAYICSGKRVYKTINGGAQWTVVAALGEAALIEVHFTDANHGWACGSEGTILKFSQ